MRIRLHCHIVFIFSETSKNQLCLTSKVSSFKKMKFAHTNWDLINEHGLTHVDRGNNQYLLPSIFLSRFLLWGRIFKIFLEQKSFQATNLELIRVIKIFLLPAIVIIPNNFKWWNVRAIPNKSRESVCILYWQFIWSQILKAP